MIKGKRKTDENDVDNRNLEVFLNKKYFYKKTRVKETAAELTNLQAQLADFNLLVDKMNTDTEVLLVQQEAQELASQNESDSRDVDGIFAEKQARMDQIHRLEQEVYSSVDSFI